jgi:hypothetical protein
MMGSITAEEIDSAATIQARSHMLATKQFLPRFRRNNRCSPVCQCRPLPLRRIVIAARDESPHAFSARRIRVRNIALIIKDSAHTTNLVSSAIRAVAPDCTAKDAAPPAMWVVVP